MAAGHHPRVEPSPVCTDRMTISRSRVQRLIDLADAQAVAAEKYRQDRDEAYASGVRDVLAYLLNPDAADPVLKSVLEV